MDRARFLIKSTGGKSVLAILVSVLLLTTALPRAARSQVSEANKQKVARKVAKDWIQVGATQYKRGFYKAAEQSLLRAQDWQGYLTAGERGKLNELLEKAHLSALERTRISEHIQKADELAKKGELIRARANLETVRYSKFLTKEEERLIAERVDKISNQISEQRKRSTEIYNRSVEFYRTGQIERAREGFLEVIKKGLLVAPPQITAAEYLVKIDNILIRRLRSSAPTEAKLEKEPFEAATDDIKNELLSVGTEPQVQQPNGLVVEEGNYLKVINRKRNIVRSYTKAVVDDAVAKAENYINARKLDNAEDTIKTAEQILKRNKPYLGDELFRQHSVELKQVSEKIIQEKKKRKS